MLKFNSFYFESFLFDKKTLKAIFKYSFDQNYFFEEEVDFSSEYFFCRDNLDLEIINNFLFSIHIALWISYYKAFPTENLYVKSWFLDSSQIDFWQKFYKNWLWEFLYKNNIKPNNLFNFINLSDKKFIKKDFNLSEKSLIPIWWWKDSLVSISLFEKANFDFDINVFWKIDNIKYNCANILWKNILLTKRKISSNLLELNKLWNYNWHVPITWIIAFIMVFLWYLYDYKYLVLSNEKSANVWNTFWEWIDINHQWSKSIDFEKDFMEYTRNNLSSQIFYFSLLRWFYELKIWEIFSKNCKKYFQVFSSCNNNFHIDEDKRLSWKIWCLDCPKCAFVFSILRPYLSSDEINTIFWEDLFYKKNLEKTFLELLWINWIKPFECVWEVEEVVYSFYKSLNFYDEKTLPDILKIFKKEIFLKNDLSFFKNLEKKLVTIYDEDIIPEIIKNKIIKKYANE